MIGTFHAFKFLVFGPTILVFLVVINWMTSPGNWWVQWPALYIGIGWVASLFRVVKTIVLAGGIAAFLAYMAHRKA
jgi:hypothetical protein